MIGDTPLRKIIGANAFTAIAAAHLRMTRRGNLLILFFQFQIVQFGFEQMERLLLVLELALLILNGNDNARRDVRHAHGRVRRINALSAMAAGAIHIHAHIVHIEFDIHIFRLRQDRYCRSGGMNASGRFRFRYALNTMYPGLVLQFGIGSFSFHHKGGVLNAANALIGPIDFFRRIAFFFGIHVIHPIQVPGKKARLFAAGTGTNFHNDILIIVRVLRYQKELQFFFLFFRQCFLLGQVCLQHGFHVGILHLGNHVFIFLGRLQRFTIGLVGFRNRLALDIFAVDFAPSVHVCQQFRIRQSLLHIA